MDGNIAENRPGIRNKYVKPGASKISKAEFPSFVGGKLNDQYDWYRNGIANVPGNIIEDPSVENSFIGDQRPDQRLRIPTPKEKLELAMLTKKAKAERDEAESRTDAWEVANAKRTGEDGLIAQIETNKGYLQAAQQIFKEELGKPFTANAYNAMPKQKQKLLKRMIEQKLADETGRRPAWVDDLNEKYDLGYPSYPSGWNPPTVGTGYRNGRK